MRLGIDHVLIAVEDLDEAIDVYRDLGFEAFYGGEHPNHGTHNALVPIAGGFYLEFIAVKDPTLASQFPHTRRISSALEHHNRYIQWALDTPDIDTAISKIRARGVEIHDPLPGARKRSDGVDVAWKTAHFEDSRLPFLIQDITPRTTRIDEPQSGLGRILSLKSIRLGTPDLSGLSNLFAQILDVQAAPTLQLGRGSLEFRESGEDQIRSVSYRVLQSEAPDLQLSDDSLLGAAFEIVSEES